MLTQPIRWSWLRSSTGQTMPRSLMAAGAFSCRGLFLLFRRRALQQGCAQFKATSATKKNPKRSTHLGLCEVCCLFRLLVERPGCRGMGGRPAGLLGMVAPDGPTGFMPQAPMNARAAPLKIACGERSAMLIGYGEPRAFPRYSPVACSNHRVLPSRERSPLRMR